MCMYLDYNMYETLLTKHTTAGFMYNNLKNTNRQTLVRMYYNIYLQQQLLKKICLYIFHKHTQDQLKYRQLDVKNGCFSKFSFHHNLMYNSI